MPVHDHVAGKRHREVIAEAFFGNLRGQLFAAFGQIGFGEATRKIAGIENFEEELIALVAVLARQRREVFQAGRFEGLKTKPAECLPDGIENKQAFAHLLRPKITRTLNNGWFHAAKLRTNPTTGLSFFWSKITTFAFRK